MIQLFDLIYFMEYNYCLCVICPALVDWFQSENDFNKTFYHDTI